MTNIRISEQIDIIREATAKAAISPEAAAAFLKRAGIEATPSKKAVPVQKVKTKTEKWMKVVLIDPGHQNTGMAVKLAEIQASSVVPADKSRWASVEEKTIAYKEGGSAVKRRPGTGTPVRIRTKKI